jgi:hypothetical protein
MAKAMLPKEVEAFQKRFSEVFQDDMTREVTLDALDNPPKEPEFPLVIVLANAIFDVLSLMTAIASLTVVGDVVLVIFSVTTWTMNIIWFFGKSDGIISIQLKKVVLRRLTWLIVLFLVGDYIPYANGFTANTLLVLAVYYREKKIIKGFWFVVAEFYRIAPKQLQQAVDEVDAHVVRRARNRQV